MIAASAAMSLSATVKLGLPFGPARAYVLAGGGVTFARLELVAAPRPEWLALGQERLVSDDAFASFRFGAGAVLRLHRRVSAVLEGTLATGRLTGFVERYDRRDPVIVDTSRLDGGLAVTF